MKSMDKEIQKTLLLEKDIAQLKKMTILLQQQLRATSLKLSRAERKISLLENATNRAEQRIKATEGLLRK